ncbi:O-antigen ligase family protein [Actibacterium lipolyticum]|uniref:O-antigen ligase-related domain-containing protein n=1 Tax=Actibacterium lipolyticum TaxID=1524263 RepID=A0A238KUU5_9RHOB|nr:O-antigen ligase family protein [Actibacterium lipolyticum]SMX46477.1 hypothetical protein COL8621_03130 [Actibacterium lipolyticum]
MTYLDARKEKAKGERVRLALLAKLTLISLLTPAFFSVGSLVFTPSRALFIVVVPFLFINLLRGKYGRFHLVDGLIIFHVFWRSLAMAVNSPSVAVQYAGSNAIILLGGYLVARATIRTPRDFEAAIRFLGWAVLLSFPLALYETKTSDFIIPLLIDKIPSVWSVVDVNYDPRLGLDRVQVVFSHPIHYGLFCSLSFSLVFVGLRNVTGLFKRIVWAGIIFICCFLSVSSGPVLSLGIQIVIIIWGMATRPVPNQWGMTMGVATIFYIFLEMATKGSGIYALVSKLTFASHTTRLRLTLLEYGMAQIHRTPILGVGYNRFPLPTWMSGSLDNYWLMVAVMFGTPAFFSLFAAFLTILIGIGRRPFKADGYVATLRLGWSFTMVSLMLTLATVAVWGEMASIMCFVLGSGVWMLFYDEKDTNEGLAPEPQKRPTNAYTRFPPREVRARDVRRPVGQLAGRTALRR